MCVIGVFILSLFVTSKSETPIMEAETKKTFNCPEEGCNQKFTRMFNLNRHRQRKHSNTNFSEHCILCGEIFFKVDDLQKHLVVKHGPSDKFYEKESAFRKSIITYRYNYPEIRQVLMEANQKS